MSSRRKFVAALEALQAGAVDEAAAILRGAIEEDGSRRRRYACPHCPATFEWPGLLDAHLTKSHVDQAAA